jgi:hypothetical protein
MIVPLCQRCPIAGTPSRLRRSAILRCESPARCSRIPEDLVERVIAERDGVRLSGEQEAMLRAVCASTDRVVCVGLAGSGKTTATHAVAEAFRAAGVPVVGAARPAWRPRSCSWSAARMLAGRGWLLTGGGGRP